MGYYTGELELRIYIPIRALHFDHSRVCYRMLRQWVWDLPYFRHFKIHVDVEQNGFHAQTEGIVCSTKIFSHFMNALYHKHTNTFTFIDIQDDKWTTCQTNGSMHMLNTSQVLQHSQVAMFIDSVRKVFGTSIRVAWEQKVYWGFEGDESFRFVPLPNHKLLLPEEYLPFEHDVSSIIQSYTKDLFVFPIDVCTKTITSHLLL